MANIRGTISGIQKIGQPYCIKKLKLNWPPRTTLSSEFLTICATNVAEQVSGRSGITVGANALKCQIEGFGPPPEKYK